MIIDGRKLAKEREEILKVNVQEFVRIHGRKPTLVAVELSDDEGSRLYLKLKKAAAERVGIEFKVQSSKFKVGKSIADGIFVQHPPGFDKKKWQEIADQIPPGKDVDCLTTTNLQLIKEGKVRFLPATVKAVGYCLVEAGRIIQNSAFRIQNLRAFLKGKRVVILGRSPIVGLPLSYWLANLDANVSLLHSKIPDQELQTTCQTADILISTVGKPGLVTGDMVKKGVIVVDCGSPKGDVVFSEVSSKAAAITPVPGGVGPLTVISLMENVLAASMEAASRGVEPSAAVTA